MNYLACSLFGLSFLVMAAQTKGGIHDRLMQSLSWLHDWSPYSYIMLLIILVSGVVSIVTMFSPGEQQEDPTAEYRRQIVVQVTAEPKD